MGVPASIGVPASMGVPASAPPVPVPASASWGTHAEPEHELPGAQSADVVQPLGQDTELPEQSNALAQLG
jgi:hypothetical protein